MCTSLFLTYKPFRDVIVILKMLLIASREDTFSMSIFLQMHLMKEDMKGLQDKFLKEMVKEVTFTFYLLMRM